MKISVVICTHNRATSLKRTLLSVSGLIFPTHEYEVIVVDNASTDETKTIVTSLNIQNLKYIYEPTLGLSKARNTGWLDAHGTYIAFLDDDTTVSEMWLKNLIEGFQTSDVKHLCVGGQIAPVPSLKKPDWLHENLLFCLGFLDRGNNIIIQNDTSFFLHGCNMSFKRTTLEHFGGFSEKMGRYGKNLMSGEDILLQKLIVTEGGSLCYHPEAAVIHYISPERLTRKWFIKRMYWEGVSSVRIEKVTGNTIKTIYELRLLFHQVANRIFLTAPSFKQYCFVVYRLGRIIESAKLR